MARRSGALELAVLGLLHDAPMHGYELRKRVNVLLGWGRAFSYGTLYPCLKNLLRTGLLREEEPSTELPARGTGGRRGRIVYGLTDAGREHFETLMAGAGPNAWDDEQFGVHFAFFGRADSATRIRILEGRRSRLQERLEGVRTALARTRERLDTYTLELQRHGLESVELEMRWLDKLISAERGNAAPSAAPPDVRGPTPGRTRTPRSGTDLTGPVPVAAPERKRAP